MTTALFDIGPLLAHIANGVVVLTPNNRLRNQLRLAYSEAQTTQAVRSPAIYSLTEWIDLQWETLCGKGYESCNQLVLNSVQQQVIWTDIVANSKFADSTANYKVLVQHLMEAYRNLQLWKLTIDDVESSQTHFASDSQSVLSEWISAFEQKRKTLNTITHEQMLGVILTAFRENFLSNDQTIFLQSFDDLPPLTLELFETASTQLLSSNDNNHHTEKQPHNIQRLGCLDLKQEALTAARWASDILDKNSNAKIGIIVPTLGNDRQTIERIFTEVFEPQYLNPAVDRYPLPFNISAGIPLANTPLIQSTLLLLALNRNELTLNDWQSILLSPFFSCEDNEREERANLLLAIKKQQLFSLTTANVRNLLLKYLERQSRSSHNENEIKPTDNQTDLFSEDIILNELEENVETSPSLLTRLQNFEELKRRHSSQATASEWIDLFQAQLETLGWPGNRTLDSVEYQQANQWYTLLEKLASMDAVDTLTPSKKEKTWHFSDIYQMLVSLASSTHFQPEVKHSPIHILGTLEAAGLRFTHSWIMGMNNKDWPPKPNPNPLLPIQLQRQYQLPRASIERENRYAAAITQQLLHSADTVVVSYITQFEELSALPSTLVEHLPDTAMSDFEKTLTHQSAITEFYHALDCSQAIELVNCEHGFVIQQNTTKGGSDIVKQQALCPFNAYAKHRLGARQPEEPALALTPLDKGNIIHNVLEIFWRETKTHQALMALSSENIRKKLNTILRSEFTYRYKRHITILGDYYFELEHQRFVNLLTDWLEFEKERPPFSVIETEKELVAEFSGITFKLRIDRIDRNQANELLLIDYKTGEVKRNKLKGPRPLEPQLPLYVLCYPEDVNAIAFAQVKTNDLKIEGTGDLSDQKNDKDFRLLSEELADWELTKQHFHDELSTLVNEYIDGQCRVDFSDNDQYSDYLLPLNRINEASYLHYVLSNGLFN